MNPDYPSDNSDFDPHTGDPFTGNPYSGNSLESPIHGRLIAEQLRHTIDLLRAEIIQTRTALEHSTRLSDQRLATLERQTADFEQRIRALQESATQFKVLAGLATGGGLLSLLSLIRFIVG